MSIQLKPHQEAALKKMKNGCILNGGTGSGKSITALAYYFYSNGGIFSNGYYIPMPDDGEGNPPDLYIITTARKRDTREWDGDMINFLLSTDPNINIYSNTVVVDSWNNIHKYTEVKNAFFNPVQSWLCCLQIKFLQLFATIFARNNSHKNMII